VLKVELIYDRDCPNVAEARANLLRALAAADRPPRWTEWARGDASSPGYVDRHASPTVLVDGVDACPGADPCGAACRLYRDADGRLSGVPSVEALAEALRGAAVSAPRSGRGAVWLVSGPAVLVALLPKLACPLCWPAYAALLAALGLGFIAEPRWLLPLSVVALALLVAALGLGAGSRRRATVLAALGALAASAVLYGKFAAESDAMVYAGAAGLLAASVTKMRSSRVPSCCTPSTKGEKQP